MQHATFSQLTQPIPKPICDRSGKPDSTEGVFVVKGETSRSHETDEKGFHGELGSSDRSRKPDYLFETTRVEQTHDGSEQPDERNSSSAHTVKEQFAPEENRDIALFNTDNEFNRAINEEDIDFDIPGLPHPAVKQSHGVNVHNLIQKIENHPQRQALQSDLQQHRAFNPGSKESQDVIKAAGNTELCEILDVEPKAQCKACLAYWDIGIVYCTCGHFLRNGTEKKQEICPVHHGSPLDSQLLYQERATPRAPLREEAKGPRVLHREFAQEEMQEETFLKYSRPVHP